MCYTCWVVSVVVDIASEIGRWEWMMCWSCVEGYARDEGLGVEADGGFEVEVEMTSEMERLGGEGGGVVSDGRELHWRGAACGVG